MNTADDVVRILKRTPFNEVENEYFKDLDNLPYTTSWFTQFGWTYEEFCKEKDRREGLIP